MRLPTLVGGLDGPEATAMKTAIRATAPDPRFVAWSLSLIGAQVRRDEAHADGAYRQVRGGASTRKVLTTYSRCVYRDGEFAGYMSAILCNAVTIQTILNSPTRSQFWAAIKKAERNAPTDGELVEDGAYHIFISHAFWNAALFDQHSFIDLVIRNVTRWFSGFQIASVAWSAFDIYIPVIEVVKLRLGTWLGFLSMVEMNEGSEDAALLQRYPNARFKLYRLEPERSAIGKKGDSKLFGPFRDVFRFSNRARTVRGIPPKLAHGLYRACFHARVFRDCGYDIEATRALLGWDDEKRQGEFYDYWASVLHIDVPTGLKRHLALVEKLEADPVLLVPTKYRIQA